LKGAKIKKIESEKKPNQKGIDRTQGKKSTSSVAITNACERKRYWDVSSVQEKKMDKDSRNWKGGCMRHLTTQKKRPSWV